MASLGEATFYVKDLSGYTMTIRANITKRFRLRMWLGRQWLRIGALILGCGFNCKVKIVDDDELDP